MIMKRKPSMTIIVPIVVLGIIASGVGLWEYHEQPQSCAVCHIMRPYYQSWKGPDLLANTHAQAEEKIRCLDCHPPTLEEQLHELVVYVKGDFENPLRPKKMPMEYCFDCHLEHEHTSYEQVMERTKDYTIDGDLINPHDPHPGLGLEQYECRVCHKMHQESLGIDYCYVCHHEGDLYEGCDGEDCHADEF